MTRMLVPVLAGLTAVAPLATDTYIPGLPQIAGDLRAPDDVVQLSLTAFLVGVAAGQLVIGPISDGVGRRRVLLGGTVAFTLFSLLAAVAPTVEVLVAARLLQGVAGAAGLVLARAVIGDRFRGVEAARRFAAVSVIVFVAPVVAPVVGGAILQVGPWRTVFVVLAAFGVLLTAGVGRWVPETLPPERRAPPGLGALLGSARGLLADRALGGHLLVMGLGGAALFAYIAGSTFVLQGVYGVTATQYGLIFAGNAVGMLIGGTAVGRLAGRVRLNTMVLVGLGGALLAGAVLTVTALVGVDGLASSWACLFVLTTGLGTMLPASLTLAQELGSRAPGTTSGLVGAAQFVLGAVAAPVTGLLGTGSAAPTAAVVTVAMLLAGLAAVGLVRPWRRAGEPDAATA